MKIKMLKTEKISIDAGVGLGLMFPVFFTTFNQYFVKRRVFILNVAQSLIGIGTMIYPLMVEFLMKTFGFRGTIAIIAAINAHTICAMLVMHPVEWHFKVVQIPVNVTHLCKCPPVAITSELH